jgi:hypothetical protein
MYCRGISKLPDVRAENRIQVLCRNSKHSQWLGLLWRLRNHSREDRKNVRARGWGRPEWHCLLDVTGLLCSWTPRSHGFCPSSLLFYYWEETPWSMQVRKESIELVTCLSFQGVSPWPSDWSSHLIHKVEAEREIVSCVGFWNLKVPPPRQWPISSHQTIFPNLPHP